jgi:hypothetical protein
MSPPSMSRAMSLMAIAAGDRHAEGRRRRQPAAGDAAGRQAGRAAGRAAQDGVYFLDQAAYTPCSVEDSKGCPKEPSWQIRAVKVRYDPVRQRVYYKGARIELFGIPLADGARAFRIRSAPAAARAFMLPDYRISGVNGAELALPYYVKLAPNRDMTLTPHVFTTSAADDGGELSGLAGARRLQHPRLCHQERACNAMRTVQQRQFRGYIEGSGSYRFTPEWRSTDRCAGRPTAPSCAATTSAAMTVCAAHCARSTSTPKHLFLDCRMVGADDAAGRQFRGISRSRCR